MVTINDRHIIWILGRLYDAGYGEGRAYSPMTDADFEARRDIAIDLALLDLGLKSCDEL
jgi:hypothetical protein